MGIFTRLSDIVNSNINSMLDRAEDPEKIVRLIIQEMEDTLVEVRASAAKAIADKKESERRKAEFDARADEWEKKAELAIGKGREDLARGAVAAKRQAQEMSHLLSDDLKAIDATLAKTNDDLLKLQNKLKEAKAKQRSMEHRHSAASDRVRINRHVHDGRLDDALARYEHWERRIDELEAEAESWVIGATERNGGRPKTLVDEFKDLEAEDDINAELEALRQRVAARSGQSMN
ncbi:MAG: phage shock protein PspA [Alphaproteobacteria bacterium]|nr:phage shock protein PspA [Alphaproteobacteria bacterium]